jgi:hypothetical protein
MSLPFESVREQLLRAGVAPRHASRYVTELREHLADLIERERASGLDAKQASDRALTLMGTDADLVRAMIDRGTPRSLAARAPWVMLAILPVVLLVAVLWGARASMMHVLWPVRGLAPSDMPEQYRALVALMSFGVTYLLGALLAAGCIAVAVRQRLVSGWFWVGLSLIALLTGILGFHTHVIPPHGGHMGGMVYSLAGLVYLHGQPNLAATLGAWALHAVVLFAIAAIAYHALRVRLMPLQG